MQSPYLEETETEPMKRKHEMRGGMPGDGMVDLFSASTITTGAWGIAYEIVREVGSAFGLYGGAGSITLPFGTYNPEINILQAASVLLAIGIYAYDDTFFSGKRYLKGLLGIGNR